MATEWGSCAGCVGTANGDLGHSGILDGGGVQIKGAR